MKKGMEQLDLQEQIKNNWLAAYQEGGEAIR